MELTALLKMVFEADSLLYAVISAPRERKEENASKITIHPIVTKTGPCYQVSTHRGAQVFHENLQKDACRDFIEQQLRHDFKQALLCTSTVDYHILISKKGKVTILKKAPTHTEKPLAHNRKKQYLLEEGSPTPFLIALGVMNSEGRVLHAKRDKFKQLNRFLEMIDDILPALAKGRKLQIVDFGCGKAYLTFALYHFLSVMHGLELEVHGLDLKHEVIAECQSLARKLQYSGLNFSVGDINQYVPGTKVDMMISLHACDTATDAALEKAVRWESEVILCVPCCQHELFRQVQSASLAPIMRFGILKERFAALATDAARAQLLDILGYNTQVLEFIDLEHTPKNLLIRAVKRKSAQPALQAVRDYDAFKVSLQIEPSLENRFHKELQAIRKSFSSAL